MWHEQNNQISKEFTFSNFQDALAFVNKVGDVAEKANHHPDIELGWGRVRVSLTTHSQGKVTDQDNKLAKAIDKL